MTTVRQVIQGKGNQVWSVLPTSTVFAALEFMAAKDIGAVLVVDEMGRLVGIFSERDYARKVILKGLNSKSLTIGAIMTSKVFVASPDMTIEECMRIMTARHFRHLPVIDDGRLAGVITIGDVVKTMISDQQFTIEQLERYIVGSTYPGDTQHESHVDHT
jgi:CBS domain-containing protein